MKLQARSLSFAVAALVVPLSGCELLQSLYEQDIEIPIPLETPPAELDATGPVASVEGSLCATADDYNCLVVEALDYSDDEEVSDPPSIPAEFPVEVTIPDLENGGEETVNVEEWADDVGLTKGLDLAQAVPVDLADLLEGYDAESVKSVSFTNLKLNWQENTFTFATAPLDLYVSTEVVEDIFDAKGLIASGKVTKVGTVPAQGAEVSGETDITFAEGGEAIFNDALKSLAFTLVFALPEDAELGLEDGAPLEDGTATKRKPVGEAKVTLKADLVYTISAADVVDAVQEATGE